MNPDEMTWLALPPEPVGAWARLQDDLRHGYHPKREDLLAIWAQAYPDRPVVEMTRCKVCEGTGGVQWHAYVEGRKPEPIGTVDCPQCDGTGQGPRPQWINEL